jgi:hypothetical protein
MRRNASPPVSPAMASFIKYLISKGYKQHDIAARFGINQGRVSEINTGKSYPGIHPAPKPPEDPQPKLPF